MASHIHEAQSDLRLVRIIVIAVSLKKIEISSGTNEVARTIGQPPLCIDSSN